MNINSWNRHLVSIPPNLCSFVNNIAQMFSTEFSCLDSVLVWVIMHFILANHTVKILLRWYLLFKSKEPALHCLSPILTEKKIPNKISDIYAHKCICGTVLSTLHPSFVHFGSQLLSKLILL